MVNQGGVEMRIAIIEDDEITRLELSKLLNTQGYETVLLTEKLKIVLLRGHFLKKFRRCPLFAL